jgi:hypothetical protein
MRTVQVIESDLSDRLSAFGTSVEGTSLYLLRAIENTVDNLEAGERLARATSEHASLLASTIRQREAVVGHMLDPDDKAINDLESAYRALEQSLPKMLLKKESIDRDDQLGEHHCDLLHTAYERNISAFAELIESTKNLRAAVIAHDLAAEERSQQSFESMGELMGDLHSPPRD